MVDIHTEQSDPWTMNRTEIRCLSMKRNGGDGLSPYVVPVHWCNVSQEISPRQVVFTNPLPTETTNSLYGLAIILRFDAEPFFNDFVVVRFSRGFQRAVDFIAIVIPFGTQYQCCASESPLMTVTGGLMMQECWPRAERRLRLIQFISTLSMFETGADHSLMFEIE